MKTNPITIVSTRVLKGATKELMKHTRLQLIEKDFIAIEFLSINKIDLLDHIICTSTNAVKSLVEQIGPVLLRQKSFYCVGDKTTQLIKSFGGKVIVSCDYAEELAKVICARYAQFEFTFTSGTIRHETLPNQLKKHAVAYTEHHVYRTSLTSHTIVDQRSGILFYSPSGVRSFLQKNTLTNETCFCIGKTTAQSLVGKTDNIIIAPKPSVVQMVQACISHYA